MSRPPRIPVQFAHGKSVRYFITICERSRRPVWANDEFFRALERSTRKARERGLWETETGVVMPDHFHLIVSPLGPKVRVVGDLSGAIKRWTKAQFESPDWDWQPGIFDRLLRNSSEAEKKWAYIRDNPVEAGLVEDWRDWPWRIGY